MVEPDRSQMTITYGAGKARSACWITNVRIQTHTQNRHALRIQTHTQNIDTHSEYRHTFKIQTHTQNTDTNSEYRHALEYRHTLRI